MENIENKGRVSVNVGGHRIEVNRLREIAESMAQRISRGYNTHYQIALVDPAGVTSFESATPLAGTMVEAHRGDGPDMTIVFTGCPPRKVFEELVEKEKRV